MLEKSNKEFFKEMQNRQGTQVETSLPPREQLRKLFGKEEEQFSSRIGAHPDFGALKDDEFKNQYICSLFLDISGSTKLGLKFPLDTVRFYKKAILQSAIEIFQVFDGHIHRLQGDAVFAFFGHKGMKKSDAIINALNAASLMQSYNKNTLSDFFEDAGLEPLKIRIGIDIGDDHQVLWSSYGIGEITEVTATSIHTDLAAKLQHKAPANSIMIGENIWSYLDLSDEFLQIKTYIKEGEEKTDKYILQDGRLKAYYQMKLFKWSEYLNSFSFLPKDQKKLLRSPEHFEIVARVADKSGEFKELKSNTKSLDKNCKLEFELVLKKHSVLGMLSPSRYKWRVINSGKEAAASESGLCFEMENYENKLRCDQATAYTGHHFMECVIMNKNGLEIGKDRFGIFVNDETFEMKNLFNIDGVK
nr:adenylate/guanylate cyclase domain-containing protein [Exiguobacterium sp. s28]